mgnify:CR=1 FL=1
MLPLTLWDVSLWLALTAIILLATAELTSPYYGKMNLLIDKKRLRKVALVIGTLFLILILMRISQIIVR